MKTTKRILALLLALAAMTFVLTACGGKGDALSKEEYEEAVNTLNTELTEIQNGAAGLDNSDIDAAKKTLEDMKKPLQDFADVTPPEEYADAHAKLQSGCNAMVDYLDTTLSLLDETDAAKQQEGAAKMMEQLQTAMTDLAAGATMMQEAQ